jgi:hypothetical protein
MISKSISITFLERLRNVALRTVANLIAYILAPGSALILSYLIYQAASFVELPANFFTVDSLWSLPRLVARAIILFCVGSVIFALFFLWLIVVAGYLIVSFSRSVDKYRKRLLEVALVTSRRKVPTSPSASQFSGVASPRRMGNDMWSEVMRHLSPEYIAKSVKA